MRTTRALVNLDALARNYKALAGFLEEAAAASGRPAPRVIAVVKAEAYGHGLVRAARALADAGAPMFAVADSGEGAALRESGIRQPILVFGAVSAGSVDDVFTHDLTPTVAAPEAAVALADAAAARGVRLRCHVKIDTGMHRMGFRHDNLRRTLPPVTGHPHLEVAGVYTQFATADDFEHPLYEQQRERFDAALQVLASLGVTGAVRHAAKSGALLRDERVWFDAVRPGLLLYGVVPPPGFTTLALEPVMSLRSRIVAVKDLRPGDSVGYGARFTAGTPSRVAVVPAGYTDGIDTRLANRGVVLVRERRAPVVGSVCMDSMMLDVTGLDAAPGDEVVIVGRQGAQELGIREMASTVGTHPWELLCRLGPRIEREYV